MFSSVIFHDHARAARAEADPRLRGLRRAGRAGTTKSGEPGRDAEPPGAARRDQRGLSQPDQAGVGRLHRGVLLQAAHRQGAARAALEGADRAEQLPQGRSRRRAVAPAGAQGARGGGGVPRHPRARTTSSSRCSGTASRSSGSSTAGCRRSRAISACRSSAPTTCTTCAQADAHPHDILLCIGTGKAFSDPKRLRYDAQAVLPEDRRRRWRRRSRTIPDALANTVRIAERCNVKLAEGENYLPNFDVPPGFTLDELLRARRRARASRSGCRGCSSSRPPARCATRSTSTSGGSRTRSR